jgi:Predicted phage phi-C31 gp36 major capsid-like protein
MDKDNHGIASGELSPEEQALQEESAAKAAITNLKRHVKEENEREFVALVNELMKPDRSEIPEIYRNPAEHRGTVALRSPTHPLYRRLSEEEREWRNPESDHWMAEWLRGQATRDHGRMLLANEKLTGLFGRATAEEGTEGAAGAESTGTVGPLIPRPLEAIVMISRDRVAKARRFATIYQMTRQNHQIPTAASMTAAMVLESSSSAQGEPTFASVDLIARAATVKAIASKEALADSAINLVNVFAQRGGSALGVLEDNEVFKDGTGVAPHISRMTGTSYVESPAGTLTYTNMLGMYFGVPQQYRDAAVWLISANVLQLLSNVRDGMGRPIYQGLVDTPGPITDDASAVGSIFRKSVYEVPFTAGDVWFGDPAAQYAFGNRQGITTEVSMDVLFANRQVMWLITERFAGANVDSSASQYATGITVCSSA